MEHSFLYCDICNIQTHSGNTSILIFARTSNINKVLLTGSHSGHILMYYVCVCVCVLFLEEQLRSHLMGQKHWYNKRQRETAQRSVFVRGLPPSPQIVEIEGLFQHFGNVNKVILDEKVLTSLSYNICSMIHSFVHREYMPSLNLQPLRVLLLYCVVLKNFISVGRL